MVTLLKGFLRNKSTILYLIIFTTMLVAIAILFNFVTYYSNIITKAHQEDTYFLITSDIDNYEVIANQKNVVDLEKVILLAYDQKTQILEKEQLTWVNLLDYNNDFIVGISNSSKMKLENDQIALTLSKNILEIFDKIYNLEKQKILFKIANNNVEFKVEKIIEANFSKVLISKNKFEKLLETDSSYSYICNVNDYSNIGNTQNSLKKIEGIKEVKFIQSLGSEASLNAINELQNVISILKYGCLAFVFVFSFLFLIVITGIVRDELEKMNLERLLGYNKLQIKKILVIKLITVNIITLLSSSIFYTFINILIQFVLKKDFYVPDISMLLQIYVVLLIFSLSFCLIPNFNKNRK